MKITRAGRNGLRLNGRPDWSTYRSNLSPAGAGNGLGRSGFASEGLVYFVCVAAAKRRQLRQEFSDLGSVRFATRENAGNRTALFTSLSGMRPRFGTAKKNGPLAAASAPPRKSESIRLFPAIGIIAVPVSARQTSACLPPSRKPCIRIEPGFCRMVWSHLSGFHKAVTGLCGGSKGRDAKHQLDHPRRSRRARIVLKLPV